MERNFANPRGTSDILPPDTSVWYDLEETARKLLELYGYREIRTPFFEDTDLFQRSLGQTSEVVSKQLLKLATEKEEGYTLRPEGTASVVRSYIQNSLDRKESLSKLYYIGPMFRGERPQKGRLRQFHQIGVEVIGPNSSLPYIDAEVIALSMHILKSLGLKGYRLKINTLGSLEDKQKFAQWLRSQLQSKISTLNEQYQQSFTENVFRILDSKDPQCQALVDELNLDYSYLSKESQEYFEQVKQALSDINIPYEVSPRLVRGLDYYTHTVYEISHEGLGSQDALGAGGRYNHLVKDLGGDPNGQIGAVGFSLGVERILLAKEGGFKPVESKLDFFVIALEDQYRAKAFQLTDEIRRCELSADMGFQGGSVKSQMRSANKLRAKYVMILGEEEMKKNEITLKNMQDGT